MPENFYTRLRDYYLKVAEVLRGEAEAASIFPNPTDIGQSRERIYAEFLRLHAPSKCNVFFGGFLFDKEGKESKQMDVIVTNDTAPRFDFHNRDHSGKSFSPVEGTLGVVSIKSTLDKAQLYDALNGIASIPPTEGLEGRIQPMLRIRNYEDWPYKVIYASNGLSWETIFGHLNEFYRENPNIPTSRRPHVIPVAGKYAIFRSVEGMTVMHGPTRTGIIPEIGTFQVMVTAPDLQAIL